MATQNDPPFQPTDENDPLELLLDQADVCVRAVQAALDRLIRQNERLRAGLAAELRGRKSAAPASSATEHPTYLAECEIVTEPLFSGDGVCGSA